MLYGGNPYRAKAYLRAADSVALLTEPIGDLIAQNRLREIPGVGEAIAGGYHDARPDRLPSLA